MINKRLTWYLESNNLISKFQSGFRAERGTNDNLVRLETFIPDAFIKREHVVQYAIRLAANPSNPAFEVTFPPQFQEYYERKPNAIKSFGLHIAPL